MSASHFFKGQARQAGFSLIELLISMVIGMVVVGAVLSAYLAAGASGRSGRGLAQVTEDASIAMSVLRANISMVGYGNPTDVDNKGNFTKAYTLSGLFGCDGSFADTSKAIEQLTCSAGAGPDSIAVAFEANKWNSVVKGTAPLDCLGNTFAADPGGYYLAYNRFYVSNGQLFCRGPGNKDGQALVDNVEDMKIFYGMAANNWAADQPDTHRVSYFTTAGAIGGMSDDWRNRVMSVRVCLVIRSADNILDKPTDYHGCSGDVKVEEGDRHLYRTFTSTIVLQNHVGAVL